MTPIENKEIRGINFKNLIQTFGLALIIVGGYSKINANLDETRFLIQKAVYMNETEVRTIKVRLDILEAQIENLKINQNKIQ